MQQQPQPQPFSEEESLDLKKYIFLILSNWYWFLISVFIALGVAYGVNRYTTPVYKVSASMVISENIRGSGLQGYENIIPGMEIYQTRKLVANEQEILKSFSMAEKTIAELDFNITYIGVGRSGIKKNYMYTSSPFYIVPDTSLTNLTGYPVEIQFIDQDYYEVNINDKYEISEKVKYGEAFHSEPFNFTLYIKDKENFDPQRGYVEYQFVMNNRIDLANYYKNKLEVSVNDDKGSVVFLSCSGVNPQQEANYLNKIMEVYIRQGLEEKNLTATNTEKFIDSQLSIINDSLQVAEAELEKFRLSNAFVDLSQQGMLIYEKLERQQKEKTGIELLERYYEYLYNYAKEKDALNALFTPATLDNMDPLLFKLIDELNELIRRREELRFTIQLQDPQMKNLDDQIRTAHIALLENVRSLKDNHTNKLSEIDKQYRATLADLQKLPVTERQLINMERQYQVNNDLYTFLLKRRAEASLAKAANVPDNKPLDYARPAAAAKIAPKTKMNYMIGLFLGFGIPLALLILIDLLNTKITSRTEIENKTRVPIVAHIGHSESGDIPVVENPKSSMAESFRGLRTNLRYMLREKDSKVISLTSTISGEGKTFVSLNLAAIFALAGKKTLLVGLDLRRPKLHKVFNIQNDKGISTYLINHHTFDELISETHVSNLFITPSGPVPPNPAELLESPRMKEFMDEARKNYDIIILDTPPVGVVTDALIVGTLADANLYLVRQDYSSKEVIDLLNEINSKEDLKNIGVIFNDLRLKGHYRSGYKYYNYNYTYRYGYVYGGDYYGKS